jgi:hypothetical protein
MQDTMSGGTHVHVVVYFEDSGLQYLAVCSARHLVLVFGSSRGHVFERGSERSIFGATAGMHDSLFVFRQRGRRDEMGTTSAISSIVYTTNASL